MMSNCDREGRILLRSLTPMIDSFSCTLSFLNVDFFFFFFFDNAVTLIVDVHYIAMILLWRLMTASSLVT